MKMKASPVLLCLPLLMAGSAFAQSDTEREHGADAPAFEQLDTDRSGSISKTEAARLVGLGEVFAKVDANGDGLLDRIEYREAINQLRG